MKVEGFGVRGAGLEDQGSGFRVQGAGFRVQGSGLRGSGLGSPSCARSVWVREFIHLFANLFCTFLRNPV